MVPGGAHRLGLGDQLHDERQQEARSGYSHQEAGQGLRSQAMGQFLSRSAFRPQPSLTAPSPASPAHPLSSLDWTVSPLHTRETSLHPAVLTPVPFQPSLPDSVTPLDS